MQYPRQNLLREIIDLVFKLASLSVTIFQSSSFREAEEGECHPPSQVVARTIALGL